MDDRPDTPPLTPLTLLGLVAGPVLSMVDSAVVNVAVPEIAGDLGGDLPTVQWTISGYPLGMAAGLAASAYLGRRFGLLARPHPSMKIDCDANRRGTFVVLDISAVGEDLSCEPSPSETVQQVWPGSP